MRPLEYAKNFDMLRACLIMAIVPQGTRKPMSPYQLSPISIAALFIGPCCGCPPILQMCRAQLSEIAGIRA